MVFALVAGIAATFANGFYLVFLPPVISFVLLRSNALEGIERRLEIFVHIVAMAVFAVVLVWCGTSLNKSRPEPITLKDIRDVVNSAVSNLKSTTQNEASAPQASSKTEVKKAGQVQSPQPQSQPQAIDPLAALSERIQGIIGTTWGLDHGYAYGAGQAFSQYDRHGQGQPPDLWLKSAAERTKGRDEAYAKLQPEIAALRHDVQAALKWPDQKIKADDRYFETLNAKALVPTPLPKTLDDDNDESY
jgi:hypothetical protein